MRGPNDAYAWEKNLLNAMRPEAVPVPLQGLPSEDSTDTPLLEAPEEMPLGLSAGEITPELICKILDDAWHDRCPTCGEDWHD